MKEGGKPRDEERRKAGKVKEGKKESHEGFDTQVRNISEQVPRGYIRCDFSSALILQFH